MLSIVAHGRHELANDTRRAHMCGSPGAPTSKYAA